MALLKLTLDTLEIAAEDLIDLLEKFGAASVSLSALSPELIFSEPDQDAPGFWEKTRITVLLPDDTDLDILLACVRNRVEEDAVINTHIELVRDKDWVKSFQEDHGPLVYSDKLCVCPEWASPPENIKHVLHLEPGLAFGTGSHPTTALCLDWLVNQDLDGKAVIDYGCGTGILGMSALLMGAKHVYAIDIDPQALDASRKNAGRNELEMQMTFLDDEGGLPAVDLLIANILLNPLKQLAPRFADLLPAGGKLVLSGLLAQQVNECVSSYQDRFDMQEPVFRQEWALLEGLRR